jgi:hypothetical protein
MTKYYCDKCCKINEIEKKFRKTFHKCDLCGVETLCSDDKIVQPYRKGKK